MISKLVISLSPDERMALQHIAETEVRTPKNVVHWLLRQEMERRGLLAQADEDRQQAREAAA